MTRLRLTVGLLAASLAVAVLAGACTTSTSVGWSAPAVSQGTVYLGTIDGRVIAVNAADGQVARGADGSPWVFDTRARANKRFYSTVAVAGGGVFAASYDGQLFALQADGGQRRWASQLSSRSTDTTVGDVTAQDGLVLVGSSDGKLYALEGSLEGFKRRWAFATGDKIWAGAVLAQGVAYVGSLDRHLYAIDAQSGREKWRFPPSGSATTIGAVAASPTVANGTVYFGSFDHKLYALNAADGALKWAFDGATGWYWSRPVVDGDRVYVANLDGNVYSLRDEGSRYSTPWPAPAKLKAGVRSDPVLVGSSLVVASRDGTVSFIDAISGQVLDEQTASAPVLAGLATDGQRVFVATTNQTLRAFDAKTHMERWSIRTDQVGK